jgi:class 3 adenylate cyclase
MQLHTADAFREALSREMAEKYLDFQLATDVRPILPSIQQPTLVLHRRGDRSVPMAEGRAVAAAIPNAKFIALDGDHHVPTDHRSFLPHLWNFLEYEPGLGTAKQPIAQAGTAIVLFADIADSTALTERMGDTAFREKARALDDALRIAVRDNGGAVIDAKTLGDGILATFPAASQAIAAALACKAAGDAQDLPLHVGLHAGDVIHESDNVFGGAVNIAARISALAPPGVVFVSRTVADLARTSAGVAFEDRGEHALKGIAEPQRVFAVRHSY